MGNYYKVILNSARFKDLSEVREQVPMPDSGYFADPARQNEISIPKNCLPRPQTSSDSADSNNVMKERVQIKNQRIPSFWSLLRQKSIGSLATFYPNFFWRFKPLTITFVFCNCIRKYGFIFSLKLTSEYISWKLTDQFKSGKSKYISEYISLRKILKRNLVPIIQEDNPKMDFFRKGR